jgi:predicted homoserine dehydrogenase-like protein
MEGTVMNLATLLAARNGGGQPIRIGLIGAGKFGSMILSQVQHVDGLHVVGIADLDVAKAQAALARVGWPKERCAAPTLEAAMRDGTTHAGDDVGRLLATPGLEVVVEATGHPIAGLRHGLAAIEAGLDVVMVNVEADALAGPALARRARAKGVVFGMAYGDQPALICELVDWVRTCGFELTAAGKGMNFEPRYRYSTPDTVWDFFGFTREQIDKGDFNPRMYNSFTDGTKAAIEMAAVANATGLDCPGDGLAFPPAGVHDLARVFRPEADGGRLARAGLVEIAASQEPDGREVLNNIRFGVFVTFKAPNAYTRDCFAQYGLATDPSGWYASMWRPFHLIGLETAVSIAAAVLQREASGTSRAFRGDVVATAKRDLKPGEVLDGEGGYLVWGKAIPARASVAHGALPIGLAHGFRLKRPVARDAILRMEDVELQGVDDVLALRREVAADVAG